MASVRAHQGARGNHRTTWRALAACTTALALAASAARAQSTFVNWETPHVSPLALTPDATRLLAVNTADGKLEVFDVSGAAASRPRWIKAIPVGIDPVSVKIRPASTEAWVVNQISDSISIIDLPTGRVTLTILTGDEPADVSFSAPTIANPAGRAFVTCAQPNQVWVYDLANLAAAPTILNIQGVDPRATITSADGSRIYVAIVGSGNNTTIVKQQDVSAPTGPYGGVNPPPNNGAGFYPPLTPGLDAPPAVSMIVRRNASGAWMDDNNHNWSPFITWNVADNDVAIIDAATLNITYAKGMLSAVMALAVRPDGVVTPVGLDARNEIRFEPVVQGTFVRVEMGAFDPAAPAAATTTDLNPHLLYTSGSIPQAMRNLSIGDPRAIVWHPTSGRAYVSGMGSNNIIITTPTGSRIAEIQVGQGPTGLALTPDGTRLYALNKFDGSISAIDISANAETARVPFFDPTPAAIKLGRPLLYDTHRTSGLGQASCASCHIDARSDFLAWDLGTPAGTMKPINQPCFNSFFCTPWHPMKGPMVTQSLQGIVGTEPLHWRGDRENVAAFAPAFTGLQGADAQPSAAEMTALTNFIATIKYPANPNRSLSDALPTSFPTANNSTGNAANGQFLFQNLPVIGNFRCTTCHTLPTGTSQAIDSASLSGLPQSLKMAQLRGTFRKRGFDKSSQQSLRGFGFNHDSSFDTLDALLAGSGFNFTGGAAGDQQRHDLEAFLMCFAGDTHPAIGAQVAFDGTNNNDTAALARLNILIGHANASVVGLIAKGRWQGKDRGWFYLGAGTMQSDKHGEQISVTDLRTGAAPGSEIAFTAVPTGSQTRLGVDRDGDGFYDAEELAVCANPGDPTNFPGSRGSIDADGTLAVNVQDIFAFLNLWFAGDPRADFNGAQGLTVQDIFDYLTAWFSCGG